MDIKEKQARWAKEKPLFEAELIHSHLLPFFNFNENTGDYEIKVESIPNTDDEDRKVAYETLNTGWAMWLRAKRDAKAQAVPEWISVGDKEPVENGNYLVCIDGDVFYLTAKWVKNHFKFLARGYGLTEDFTDWRYCEGVKVTHWMPLPDSPKVQEPANDQS